MADSLEILRASGRANPQGGCDSNGDANCDGHISAMDALFVLRIVVGLAVAC